MKDSEMEIIAPGVRAAGALNKLFGRLLSEGFVWDAENVQLCASYNTSDQSSIGLKLDLIHSQGGIEGFTAENGRITIASFDADTLELLYRQATQQQDSSRQGRIF